MAAPLFELHTGQDSYGLQDEAQNVIERDAKHALKSPDENERLQGARSVQLLDY